MIPIGKYIEIEPVPEKQTIIMQKSAYQRAKVKEISPDIKPEYACGSEIFYIGGRQVNLGGQSFIHSDHIVLWQ